MNNRSARITRALLCLYSAAALATTVTAQTVNTSPAAKLDEKVELEKFVVTGTAIPTAEGETFSPITIYSPTEMVRLGAATPIEVVRHLPSFTGNNATEQRTNGGSGAAGVNLRGLAGTLTLFDSRRTAGFDNFNSVPNIAIGRIEVVKDGAGAVYGSDALSGVFNIIMVSRFEGLKLDAYYGNTWDNDAGVQRYGMLFGQTIGKTNVVVGAEYYNRHALYSNDRIPSDQADQRFRGGVNGGSPTFSGRATARVGSATAPVQDLVLAPGKTIGLTASDFVVFNPVLATSDQMLNFRRYTPSISADERAHIYGRINQKITDQIDGWARIMYTRDRFYNGLAPSPMPGTGAAGNALRDANRLSPQIPTGFFIGDNVNSTAGNVTNGVVPFRTIALGPRQQVYTRNVYEVTGQLDGKLQGDWHWSVGYTYGLLYRDQLQQGAPGRTKLVAHILDGSYNPWALDTVKGVGPTGKAFDNPAALADSAAKGNTDDNTANRGYDFSASGTLASWTPGDIKAGVGGDYYRLKFSTIPDPIFFTGDLLGLNGSNPSISRSYGKGYFAEVHVPLASPAMNIPFVRSFRLMLGGRWDRQTVEGYQNGNTGAAIGSTFDSFVPKQGVMWNLTDDLLFRGTWNSGFRLPTLTQLFRAPTTSVPQLRDPLGFPIANQTTITLVGNPNLGPEKARTYSMGFIYSPKSMTGFSVSADYYYGVIKGLVADGSQYMLDQNALSQPRFVAGQVSSISPTALFGSQIVRSASGSVTTINSTYFNISARETTGVDWAVTYVWPRSEWGRFTTKVEGNSALTWDLTPSPGRPSQSFLGTYIDVSQNAISPGSIPKHKGYLSQLWEKGNWAVLGTVNYIHKLQDNPAFTQGNVMRDIEAFVTLDLNVEYRIASATSGWRRWAKETTIHAGIQNVTDESAPFAAGAFNDSYDVTTHTNKGRFLYMQVSKKL